MLSTHDVPRFSPRVWGWVGSGETREVAVEVPDLRESVRPAEGRKRCQLTQQSEKQQTDSCVLFLLGWESKF